MHHLQSKHIKLKKEEVEILLQEFNMSVVQLPKISKDDVCVPIDCNIGDVLLVERKVGDTIENYYRVVS
jgi:DNA-directed RNA polymerase subunit H (RpoH/RPB5)